jgi:pyrroline-5-carboxylate reductase
MNSSIGFIGGGRITRIMLEGFRRAGITFSTILVSDQSPEVLEQLKTRNPTVVLAGSDNTQPAGCDYIFLALHPPAMAEVLSQIKSSVKKHAVIVSLAPKVKIQTIATRLDGFQRIARMIPNAPSIIGKGYNPMVFSSGLSAEEQRTLRTLLATLGKCPEVPEQTLEAYAIVAAMGPTYFWFQWAELERLGISFGLSSDAVREALHSMVCGASATVYDSTLSSVEAMDLVPVRPLAEEEDGIRQIYRARLEPLYAKLIS